MVPTKFFACGVLIGVCGLSVAANGQTASKPSQPKDQKPSQPEDARGPGARETSTSTEVRTEEIDRGGFWMFPEPAPLEGPIATDRPGFSDAASLVPRGHTHLEGGYTFTYDRERDRRLIDHQFPELGFRTGLTEWLEFRLNWAGYSLSEVLDTITTIAGRHVGKEEHDDGGRDMSVGFKLPLLKHTDSNCLPNVSVIPTLYVPTGSNSKSANNVVPELKFPWNYPINECFTVYGSVLGRVPDGPDGQFFQTAVTLAGNYKFNDCVSAYVEYLGVYPSTRSEDCLHLLSAGPVFKITENFSVDVRASLGLNEQAPDFQTSVGFGIRF